MGATGTEAAGGKAYQVENPEVGLIGQRLRRRAELAQAVIFDVLKA